MADKFILGIMSGTSMDGVDAALCRMEAGFIKLERHWHRPFPAGIKQRIQEAAAGNLTSHHLAQLHHDLGRYYARVVQMGLGKTRPLVTGLHGQTVFHQPGKTAPATLQLGEPAYLAERLQMPVVANFRAADLAAGGQGAPLATAFHIAAFQKKGQHICVNNLGGISNVTSIDARGRRKPRVLSFDTGPANMLLDLAARHYSGGRATMDRDGAWARRGRPERSLISRWMRHPFFKKAPPKSTGREMFGESCFRTKLDTMRRMKLSRDDAMATLTEWTARTVTVNYRDHLPSGPCSVVLCGGGAANTTLVKALEAAFIAEGLQVQLQISAALGWPIQAVEPAAFAWLAWLRLQGKPGNLPETTGARRAVQLGQMVEV